MNLEEKKELETLIDLETYFFSQACLKPASYRLFHGRGCTFPALNDINIDIHHNIVVIVVFSNKSTVFINRLVEKIKSFISTEIQSIYLQKRFLKPAETDIIYGEKKDSNFAFENSLRYALNFNNVQNPGFFMDMRLGREKISQICHKKSVLNLFAYTCSFSVAALKAGANSVTNIDMKSSFLEIGRKNHASNDISTKNVKFLKHDILKSFAKLKRLGPWDIIIIDPPNFQKNSFSVERDYVKIIKKLNSFSSNQSDVFACLNSPHQNIQFLVKLFTEHQPNFEWVDTLHSSDDFPEKDCERGLKILHYKNKN